MYIVYIHFKRDVNEVTFGALSPFDSGSIGLFRSFIDKVVSVANKATYSVFGESQLLLMEYRAESLVAFFG